MALTPDQITSAQWFHYAPRCARTVGPRGGITFSVERWHRNGRTQTWKTRPDDFRIPVKYGLREYSAIERHNAYEFHAADDCPVEELRY